MSETFDLVLERTLDAPLEQVWRAYTDAGHMKRWFAPRPYEITECEFDLEPGGIFRIRMTGPDGFDTGHGVPGRVLGITKVEGKSYGLKVFGVASSGNRGYDPYNRYGYGYNGGADLKFNCEMDRYGRIRDIDVGRR